MKHPTSIEHGGPDRIQTCHAKFELLDGLQPRSTQVMLILMQCCQLLAPIAMAELPCEFIRRSRVGNASRTMIGLRVRPSGRYRSICATITRSMYTTIIRSICTTMIRNLMTETNGGQSNWLKAACGPKIALRHPIRQPPVA